MSPKRISGILASANASRDREAGDYTTATRRQLSAFSRFSVRGFQSACGNKRRASSGPVFDPADPPGRFPGLWKSPWSSNWKCHRQVTDRSSKPAAAVQCGEARPWATSTTWGSRSATALSDSSAPRGLPGRFRISLPLHTRLRRGKAPPVACGGAQRRRLWPLHFRERITGPNPDRCHCPAEKEESSDEEGARERQKLDWAAAPPVCH